MHVPFADQRRLVELAAADATLAGLRFRIKHMPEHDVLDELRGNEQHARERAARAQIALEDSDRHVNKTLTEVTSLRVRRERTEEILARSGGDAAERRELSMDLTAVRRLVEQAEARLHDTSMHREAVKDEMAREQATLDTLTQQIAEAESARAQALADLDAAITAAEREREQLAAQVPGELLALYTEVAAERGAGAGELEDRRCGACQMELDNTTIAAYATTPVDEVLLCPECGAILVRKEDSNGS